MGAESTSMQSVTLMHPQCAISQTMKSQRNIRNELQRKVKEGVISISKKTSVIFLYFRCVFRDKGIAISQTKFRFFLACKQKRFGLFLAVFGFLLKFLSGNLECCCSWRAVSVFGISLYCPCLSSNTYSVMRYD